MFANFSFFSFACPCELVCLQAEDGLIDRPQAIASKQKSEQGNASKRAKKSDKELAFIPYLDNIETTLMKIFLEMPIKSVKIKDLWYNRLLSVYCSTLSYDRIVKVIFLGVKYPREKGSLLENIINTR